MLLAARSLVERHGLRAYDAVQLAAAVELNDRWTAAGVGAIVLVSADLELNVAGRAEGLAVDDPNVVR